MRTSVKVRAQEDQRRSRGTGQVAAFIHSEHEKQSTFLCLGKFDINLTILTFSVGIAETATVIGVSLYPLICTYYKLHIFEGEKTVFINGVSM